MKIINILIFLFVTLFINCTSSGIKGNWLLLEAISPNDTLMFYPERRIVLDFTDDKELLFYHEHKRSGIGFYYYKVLKDSLTVYNVEVNPETGINDTINSTKALFTIRHDTLFIDDKKYNKKYVYKRVNSS